MATKPPTSESSMNGGCCIARLIELPNRTNHREYLGGETWWRDFDSDMVSIANTKASRVGSMTLSCSFPCKCVALFQIVLTQGIRAIMPLIMEWISFDSSYYSTVPIGFEHGMDFNLAPKTISTDLLLRLGRKRPHHLHLRLCSVPTTFSAGDPGGCCTKTYQNLSQHLVLHRMYRKGLIVSDRKWS